MDLTAQLVPPLHERGVRRGLVLLGHDRAGAQQHDDAADERGEQQTRKECAEEKVTHFGGAPIVLNMIVNAKAAVGIVR